MPGDEQASDPWRSLLKKNLGEAIDKPAAERFENEFDDPNCLKDNIDWTAGAMDFLGSTISESNIIEVLNRCAHVLPYSMIDELKQVYTSTGSVIEVHSLWQQRFIQRLTARYPDVPREWLDIVIKNGWGEAGRIEGDVIIATKVPRDLYGYFRAENLSDRSFSYCHCGRVNEIFKEDRARIPSVYCNCGGGFYRYNWERIVGPTVKVELISTIMDGGEVCSFRIRLPVRIR